MNHRTSDLYRTAACTALMLALISCRDTDSAASSATDSVSSDFGTETAVQENNGYLHDNLPADLDFGGEAVVISARGDGDSYPEIDAEQDGDIINDTVYNRNLAIEERLNVDLIPYKGESWTNYNSEVTKIRSSITSGDNAWQIIAGWNSCIVPLAIENYFLPLNDIRYLDTSMPWWNQSSVDSLNIAGSTYFVTGDISLLTSVGCSYVLFVNDKLASDYDIGSLPDVVRSGNWTLEAFQETAKKVLRDIDGNGIYDDQDLYGFVNDSIYLGDHFYVSANIRQITLDKDLMPVFTPQIEAVTRLTEYLYPMFFNGTEYGSYMCEGGEHHTIFQANRALIISAELLDAQDPSYRGMETSYTIIPYPKLDENQDRYYSNASNAASIWSIPMDNPNPETAAAVMEAMASYNYNILTPVFFETCMQDKIARNEDTIEMLGIIREGARMDAELLYKAVFGESCYVMRSLFLQKSSNVASWYAANEKRITAAIETTIQSIKENANK